MDEVDSHNKDHAVLFYPIFEGQTDGEETQSLSMSRYLKIFILTDRTKGGCKN